MSLHQLSRSADFEVLPRGPLIPDITDPKENLEVIPQFIVEQDVKKIILLPNNPLWLNKCHPIGRPVTVRQDDPLRHWQDEEQLTNLKAPFLERRIHVE